MRTFSAGQNRARQIHLGIASEIAIILRISLLKYIFVFVYYLLYVRSIYTQDLEGNLF